MSPLGIQSYCFRGTRDNAEVITRLKACGVRAIELCAVHANFDDPAAAQPVIEQYRAAGVEILSIGVQLLAGDVEKERAYFACAQAAGARYMSVTFPPGISAESLRAIEGLAAAYDLHLGIHNHGGYDWLGSRQMLRYIFSQTNERIGLTLDTAWAMQAGEDPLAMLREFAPRVYGLHLKDFVFDRAGHHEDVVVGAGNLDLHALAQVLRDSAVHGFAVIEYEGDVDNPVPALTACVQQTARVFA